MLGQIRIEFIFGMILFSILIFFIVTQSNTMFSSLLVDSKSDALKTKAANVIKILVEDSGDPPTWENIAMSSPGNVKRVGFAITPYNLSRQKVQNLSYNCSNFDSYNNLLGNFEMKAFRLRVYNSTQQILNCGFQSLEPISVTETRYVFIDNEYGRVVLELWT